ncbi:U2 snRNP complex subunit msl1 [Homalodisca vitripennis]|nr:U2 snRNP complex subunit msl1 [Homalodisca vitripennis]
MAGPSTSFTDDDEILDELDDCDSIFSEISIQNEKQIIEEDRNSDCELNHIENSSENIVVNDGNLDAGNLDDESDVFGLETLGNDGEEFDQFVDNVIEVGQGDANNREASDEDPKLPGSKRHLQRIFYRPQNYDRDVPCPSLLAALTLLRVIFLFPRLKRELKRKHWELVENTETKVTRFLRGIPVKEFQGAFLVWQNRLRRWDVQRIREQRQLEKLRQRGRKRSGGGCDGEELMSLWPSPDQAQYLQVQDSLPVAAFGCPITKLNPV